MEIKHICSMGSFCHPASFLKRNKLKIESFPFDWTFSSVYIVGHCLETNFSVFLDKSHYVTLPNGKCGHNFYHGKMFNHHNPLTNADDYDYFIRCIDRFYKVLASPEKKLFIMMFGNMENIDDKKKNSIIEFNNKLKIYSENYILLAILHLSEKEINYHTFTTVDNIDFLELHTVSKTTGVRFVDEADNIYLDDVIKNKYQFDIVSSNNI